MQGLVLNTRPREQAAALSASLRAAGFEPVEVPLVELALLENALPLLEKISPDLYDGILLTSPNLLCLLQAHGLTVPEAWLSKPWYLIGPRARKDVEALGARVAFVPEKEFSVEGLLRELPPHPGLHLLHPGSAKTRLDPAVFARRELNVHNMAVYEPRCPEGAEAALEAEWPRLKNGGTVLLASGSAVHHLFLAAPRLARSLGDDDGPMAISIGTSTSRALRMYKVERFLQTPTADNEGFVRALQSIAGSGNA